MIIFAAPSFFQGDSPGKIFFLFLLVMEVCADRLDSVRAALLGGASRVELCSSLSEGGLTPTPGTMREAKRIFGEDGPVFALIRPRAGDFLYSEVPGRTTGLDRFRVAPARSHSETTTPSGNSFQTIAMMID